MTDISNYEERAARFKFITKKEIEELAQEAIFLDVRTPGELQAKILPCKPFVNIPLIISEISQFKQSALKLLPDKNSNSEFIPLKFSF